MKKEVRKLKTFFVKIRPMIRAGRSVGSVASKGISVLNALTERETRIS